MNSRFFTTSAGMALACIMLIALGTGCGGQGNETKEQPATPLEAAADASAQTTAEIAGEEAGEDTELATPVAAPEVPEENEEQQAYEAWKRAMASGANDAPWESLVKDRAPRTLIDGLDLLDIHTYKSGKGEYTFSLLFHTTKDLDKDYHFTMNGYVYPPNEKKLPEELQGRDGLKFHHRMNSDPTSAWKAGEYHVVRVKAETPLIPYNLQLLGFSPTEDVFWNHVGNRLDLGWQWAPQSEEEFTRRVVASKTPAELYTLAPVGPRVSPQLQQAIDKKWAELTAAMKAQPLIEGLDLLALDTKATGEEEYTFSFLVKCTAALERDYIFTVIGGVDPGHLQHLKSSDPETSYASWYIDLKRNPMPTWKPGEYHVAPLIVETELIPYNISVWVSPRGDDGNWNWDGKGNRIDLGWQADVGDK